MISRILQRAAAVIGSTWHIGLILIFALYIDMQMHPLHAADLVLVDKDTQMLYVIDEDDSIIFESKVVIGRDSRPTPNFTDTITHVVTNPYWNIPSNLLRNDVLPKIRKNPDYFNSAGLQVLDREGVDVTPTFKHTLTMQPGWRMRQKPSAGNALGLAKFMLQDRMKHGPAIFLHDTNKPELYDQEERRFSSGCIRIEKWQEFSELLGVRYVPGRQEQWNKIEPVTIHIIGQ